MIFGDVDVFVIGFSFVLFWSVDTDTRAKELFPALHSDFQSSDCYLHI